MQETLKYIGNKSAEQRYIRITKETTNSRYTLKFSSGGTAVNACLNAGQYKEFRLWLNRQHIADFNSIVDAFCDNYRPGNGWQRNWTYYVCDAIGNKGISTYVINTIE